MAFSFTNSKGATYYLHKKVRITKAGKESPFYFFAKEIKQGEPDVFPLDEVPSDRVVSESSTGLPVLKKAA